MTVLVIFLLSMACAFGVPMLMAKRVPSNRWLTVRLCAACDGQLSYHDVMYSFGRCPLCGYKDPRAITVVKTRERAFRLVSTGPWWQFWRRRRVEWKED